MKKDASRQGVSGRQRSYTTYEPSRDLMSCKTKAHLSKRAAVIAGTDFLGLKMDSNGWSSVINVKRLLCRYRLNIDIGGSGPLHAQLFSAAHKDVEETVMGRCDPSGILCQKDGTDAVRRRGKSGMA